MLLNILEQLQMKEGLEKYIQIHGPIKDMDMRRAKGWDYTEFGNIVDSIEKYQKIYDDMSKKLPEILKKKKKRPNIFLKKYDKEQYDKIHKKKILRKRPRPRPESNIIRKRSRSRSNEQAKKRLKLMKESNEDLDLVKMLNQLKLKNKSVSL